MRILPIEVPKDISEVEKVTSLSFSQTTDSRIDDWFSIDEMSASIVEKRGVCLKAVDEGGNIIGVIHAMQENLINGKEGREKWVITNMAVISNQTGKGVGSQLLSHIEDEARKHNIKKMFVHTNLGDDKVVHFYEKNGYIHAGEIKDYYYAGSAVFLLKYL